jgi:predicted anti-sigma-YlaC factor YlaD
MISADFPNMGCSSCREHLSADLDGEADQARLPAARAHLDECRDCARWFSDAAMVNRLIRTAPADPAPGMTEAQLANALAQLPPPPSPRRRTWHRLARLALGGIGASQAALGAIALGLPGAAMGGHAAMTSTAMTSTAMTSTAMTSTAMTGTALTGAVAGGHAAMMGMAADGHTSILGADLAHMSHESAAWNLALGVAFLVGAGWTRHLAGTLPVLGSFVLVLSLVSALDLISGNVDPARVGSHLLVVAGLGLIVLILITRPPEFQPRPLRTGLAGRTALAPDGGAEESAAPAPAAAPTRPDPAARHRAA